MPAWMQTSSGFAVDLLAPDLSGLNIWSDIARPLAALTRFAGQAEANSDGKPSPAYSVAQHSVVGGDAILSETGDATAALAFLIHDAHEPFITDITTPTAEALEAYLATAVRMALGADAVVRLREAIGARPLAAAIEGLRKSLDRRIRVLAGLPPALPAGIDAVVRAMDLRMLDLERRQILGPVRGRSTVEVWPAAVLGADPVRIHGALRPWTAAKSADEWIHRFEAWRIRPAKAA